MIQSKFTETQSLTILIEADSWPPLRKEIYPNIFVR